MPFFVLIFFWAVPSYGFLDFVGDQTKKAIEVATYVDAAAELAAEISPDKDLEQGAKDVRKRSEAIRQSSSNLRYLSRTSENVLQGPDWSSRRLETNIRNTTDYVRRLNRLLARVVALGNDGVIALNTTETNVALNEMQKNQQAMILQNQDYQLRLLEREQEEAEQWQIFAENQRTIRGKEEPNGKF